MASKYIYPAPVYEARLSNGGRLRLSFASPAGKPIDIAAGRRCVEEIYFNDTGNEEGCLEDTPAARAELVRRRGSTRESWATIAREAREMLERGEAAAALALLQRA